MNKYLVVLILLSSGELFGQDTLQNDNDCMKSRLNYRISLKNNRHRTVLFEMGGKPITGGEFMEHLNTFPESAFELRKAKKSQKLAMIGTIVFFPVLVGGSFYARQKQVPTLTIIGGDIVTSYAFRGLLSPGMKHIENSMIIYNQKVCGIK